MGYKFNLKNNPDLAIQRKRFQNRAYYARNRARVLAAHRAWRNMNPGYDAQYMCDARTKKQTKGLKMTQRTMGISIIGCLYNCIREYDEKLRKLHDLLDDRYVFDAIESDIIDYLDTSDIRRPAHDVLDEFFDTDSGMIKIGTDLIEDLLKAKNGNFPKMELLVAETDEEKAALKQIVDALH